MKSNTWKIGAVVAISVFVLASATSANGQTVARFSVPFQFLAGDQALPAGEYQVRVDQASQRVDLRHESGRAVMYLQANPSDRSWTAVEHWKLVFKTYGKMHILGKVWRAGNRQALEFPMSKAERELARTQRADSTIQVASVTTR